MRPRELIINVDDIGIHEGAVGAAVETITDGVAASGSVMTVCAGSKSAVNLLGERPHVPVGVHLVLIRDHPEWGWSPLTGGRSITDEGCFLGVWERERLLAQADAREVEAEFRAQIEVVLDAGIRPSHVDWHCLADGGREDIFDLTLALADEYGTGIRAWTDRGRQVLRAHGRVAQDQPFLDSFSLSVEGKQRSLLDRIRSVPHGLSEWAMHPALPVRSDSGSDVRNTDYDVLMAPSVRHALVDEGIIVLGHENPRLRPSAAGTET